MQGAVVLIALNLTAATPLLRPLSLSKAMHGL